MEHIESFQGVLESGIDGTVYVDGSPVNGVIRDILRHAGIDIDNLYSAGPELRVSVSVQLVKVAPQRDQGQSGIDSPSGAEKSRDDDPQED